MPKKSIPIAGGLIDGEFRKRREGLLAEIRDGILETSELKNGFHFSFPKDDQWILKLAEMITLERECCPFLNFKLNHKADRNSISLELTGKKEPKSLFPFFLFS